MCFSSCFMVNSGAHIISTWICLGQARFQKTAKENLTPKKQSFTPSKKKKNYKKPPKTTDHRNRNCEVCPWSLGSSECPRMPRTCQQSHQWNVGRARCCPAPAAPCLWHQLLLGIAVHHNSLMLLTRSKIKYLLVT